MAARSGVTSQPQPAPYFATLARSKIFIAKALTLNYTACIIGIFNADINRKHTMTLTADNFDRTHLAAAMSTPETDVEVPSRHKAGSLTSQVAALEVGECTSKVIAVPLNATVSDYMREGSDMRKQLRNSVQSSVRLAAQRSGGEHEIEVSSMVSTSGRLYIVAVITRTA